MPPPPPPPPPLPPPLPNPDDEFIPAHSNVRLTRELLEHTLGFKVLEFPGRYLEAFTHKSAAAELGRPSLERLEFLGDSVVNFSTAKYLFDKYPREDEGFMTILRTRLTCSSTLANLARALRLDRFVIMNGVSMRRGWFQNEKTLEDLFESLVGAIYLDCGFATARTFYINTIERYVDFVELMKNKNYKDRLMRWTQVNNEPLPSYSAIRSDNHTPNDNHKFVFHVSVMVRGQHGRGSDYTKKAAEPIAASVVLQKLGVPMD